MLNGDGTPIQPQAQATPRTALAHMRQAQSPTEAAEVAKFNLLMPADKMEFLYRLCIKLGDFISAQQAQFPLIDQAFRELASAVGEMQAQAKPANDKELPS